MKKNIKFIVVLSLFTLSPIVLTTTLSCSKANQKYFNSDIGGLNDYFNKGQKENILLKNKAEEIRKNGTKKEKELLNQKTILISGKINDLSFNQSIWEAVSKFSSEINTNNNSYFERVVVDQISLNEAFEYAIKKGYKNWIITGFQFGGFLSNWLKIGKNQEIFDLNKIRIIVVDWYSDTLTIPGRTIGVNFRTQESAFVTSYAAARLLSEINQYDNSKFKKVYLNSFGGGDFSGVTNFNYGFYEGMKQFNEDSKASDRFNKYKVYATDLDLTTGFAPTTDARTKVNSAVDGSLGKQPQITLPVAGGLLASAIDRVKEKRAGQWVVGVDTNQALAFAKDKNLLLTSIEKRIAIAIYKVMISIYGLSDYDPKEMDNFLEGNRIDEEGFLVNKNNERINYDINRGYKDGFVGTSKSTLDPTLKLKLKNSNEFISYSDRFDQLLEKTWNEFFGEDKKSGRFNTEKNGNNNGLKPTEKQLKEFNEAINKNIDDIKDDKLKQQIIDAVTSLNNVYYGYMTENNFKNYFKPVINQINNIEV